MYRAVVIVTLLYASEAWVLYRKHVNLREQFHQRCICSIMGIQWQDYIMNEEVLVPREYADAEAVEMDGQATSPIWMLSGCQRSSSVVNRSKASKIKGHPRSASRTS